MCHWLLDTTSDIYIFFSTISLTVFFESTWVDLIEEVYRRANWYVDRTEAQLSGYKIKKVSIFQLLFSIRES